MSLENTLREMLKESYSGYMPGRDYGSPEDRRSPTPLWQLAGAVALGTAVAAGVLAPPYEDPNPHSAQRALLNLQKTAAARGEMPLAQVGREIIVPQGLLPSARRYEFPNMPKAPNIDGPAPGAKDAPPARKSKAKAPAEPVKPPFFKPRRRLEETLVEYYKQRLDEKLDRSSVKGTPAQRLAAAGRAAGVPESLVGLATARARTRGTPETRGAEARRKKAEQQRARQKWAGKTAIESEATLDKTRALGLPTDAAHLMSKKEAAAVEDKLSDRAISRRERGIQAERETGDIRKRWQASRYRLARHQAGHAFPARGQGRSRTP